MIKKIILGIALITGFASCGEKKTGVMTTLDGFAQGTTYHIAIKDKNTHDISQIVDSIFTAVDNSMSIYKSESLISKINRGETDSLDKYLIECISLGDSISGISDGMYDITVKPLTSAYGFAAEDTVKRINIDSLMQFVGYQKISIDSNHLIKQNPNIQIDLNSIAKGYTVDLIAKHFDKMGFTDYIIEVGGEIFARGTNNKGKDWVVGIDKPIEGNNSPGEQLQVAVKLSGKGLATSGNYRKFYLDQNGRKIVHTINPKTGEPAVNNLLSVTVIAPNTAIADAYATLFMVMGLDKTMEFLKNHKDLEAYLVYSGDNGEYKTFATSNLITTDL